MSNVFELLMQPEAIPRWSVRPAWHRLAACRGVGREVFFPPRGGSLAPARALCNGCPVAAECAAAGGAQEGVWGGATPRERSRANRAA